MRDVVHVHCERHSEEVMFASSFAEILEKGEKMALIDLEYDESRGNYIVRSKRAA